MMYIQAQLTSGTSTMTTWIEKHKKLKVGCTLTLKETGNTIWKVEGLYACKERDMLHTDWKVGGLQ